MANPDINPFYQTNATNEGDAGMVVNANLQTPRQLDDGRWQLYSQDSMYGLTPEWDAQHGWVTTNDNYQGYNKKLQQVYDAKGPGGGRDITGQNAMLLMSAAIGGFGAYAGAGEAAAATSAAEYGGGYAGSLELPGAVNALAPATGAAANTAGLTQMGIDAGLSGQALEQFVANGGAASLAEIGGSALGAGLADMGGELVAPGAENTMGQNFTDSQFLQPSEVPLSATPPLSETPGGTPWNEELAQQELDANFDLDPNNQIPPTDSTVPPLSPLQKAWQKATDDPLGTITKLGTLGLGAAGVLNARSASNKAAGQISQVGAPQAAVGNQLLQQFQSGTLSTADKYRIDQWEQAAIAQLRQFYEKAGIGTSTSAMTAEQNVRAKAEAMRSQALLSTLQTGLSTLNITDKNQLEAIKMQYAGDQNAMTNASQFLQAYAALQRTQGTTTGTAKV